MEEDKTTKDSLHRRICYTIFNFTDDDIKFLQDYTNCKMHLAGLEICPETGKPHIQGYIEFIRRQRFTKLQKDFPRGTHFEVARGTRQDSVNYIKTNPNKPPFQVIVDYVSDNVNLDTSNVQEVKSWISEGITLREILDDPTYGATSKTIKLYRELAPLYQHSRNWRPEVTWLYGEPGNGKSQYVETLEGSNLYKMELGKKWFDGYDGHEAILWDDFDYDITYVSSTDSAREKLEQKRLFQNLLSLCDRYSYRANVKGSSVQILAKRIYIVAHEPPWFHWRPDYSLYPSDSDIHTRPSDEAIRSNSQLSQLMRRLTRIIHLVLDNPDKIVYPKVEKIIHGTKSEQGGKDGGDSSPLPPKKQILTRGMGIFKR